ncbi:GIY-YIG nuclease family protein, partial [Helicobacter pylori]|nr:GIY-YIG nuclease family protein [Helicobacter pylori]
IDEKNMKNERLVYVFVIQGKIFKIGHSITPIMKRVQSYNCGKVEYRKNGTCSTTNYFVLQSLLKINKIVQVYAFFPEQPTYTLFGKTYQDSFSTSKRVENVILENFIKIHNKKPIGCTQT